MNFNGSTVFLYNSSFAGLNNSETSSNIEQISKYLSNHNADIIGVQEDFNYHNELMSSLDNNYLCGKISDKFSLSKLFSKIECLSHFPLPRFKSDGINILINKSRCKIKNEYIESWKKSNGYIGHANDLLTHKGFRFYTLSILSCVVETPL